MREKIKKVRIDLRLEIFLVLVIIFCMTSINAISLGISMDSLDIDSTNKFICSFIGFLILISIYLISRNLKVEASKTLNTVKGISIIAYLYVFIIVILSMNFRKYDIYFKGFIEVGVILINSINYIVITSILMKLSNRIGYVKFDGENKKYEVKKNIISVITLIFLSLFMIVTIWISLLAPIFIPEEIKVYQNEKEYNIRVDSFLRERKDAQFTYYESMGAIFMRKLSKEEVPEEIKAENNRYYNPLR